MRALVEVLQREPGHIGPAHTGWRAVRPNETFKTDERAAERLIVAGHAKKVRWWAW